ncbi:hypothetical protein M9H77_05974 [Catharanthus roseus]|uniref:Uncharacterized protein n=1 Tax=Catharanthus roseus TaxID=4058 RepID=A0ACC0BQX9_CATRO|nr:hypothetical protein M9H77_05974 [Catharanthus roseus]
MASLSSLFSSFLSLLLLIHLACFNFTTNSAYRQSKKRKISDPFSSNINRAGHHQSSPPPSSRRLKLTTPKALSSSWSFLKRLFSSKSSPSTVKSSSPTRPLNKPSSIPSPCSSTRSLTQPIILPDNNHLSDSSLERTALESDISSTQSFFPLRNDIYPCPICGEIFPKPNLLEQHQSIKHAVSELIDGDTGKNIVKIIFKTGWPENRMKNPIIHRILKIHNSPKILTRFEEYRECVMSKAVRNGVARCVADGNELLRFHCTTFLCDLGQNGNSDLCNQQYCSVCGIIKSGFSHKMDGISTLSTSWRAHVSIPEEIEEEFKFMHVKRAMLVCRVIAGRVGCDPEIPDKDDPGFDSLVGCRGTGNHTRLDDEDELLVFNPRAVLPCFAIVYTV